MTSNISWSVFMTAGVEYIASTGIVFISDFILIRKGFLDIYSVLLPHLEIISMTEERQYEEILPFPTPSKSWRLFSDYIYRHLVGVRPVFISNAGCDPKSTQARSEPRWRHRSSADWFPENTRGRESDGDRWRDEDKCEQWYESSAEESLVSLGTTLAS